MVEKILEVLSSREDIKTCTTIVEFLAARNVPRFVHTENQEEIIRARSRYSSVSFLHGQCYPLLFHGRYQSYIFIVGIPHLSLASSLLSLLLACARLFPMCLWVVRSPTISFFLSAYSHHLRRRRFYLRRTVFARGICVGGYYFVRHTEVGMESRAKRAIAHSSSFCL